MAKVEVVGSADWGELLANIFASRACSLSLSSGTVSVTADAGDLVVGVYEAGTDRADALRAHAGLVHPRPWTSLWGGGEMVAKRLTPILNVSNIQQSFVWFEKLGWTKAWDWGVPPTFGGVCSGGCEIFLCQNGQGGRGRSGYRATFGPESNEAAEKAVWMSIWVDDVDAVHGRCVEQGLDVTWPPTDMPWNAREMHVRHPDGHVFRISRGLDETE